MITLPEVQVVGTLTADPELRFTPNGVAVVNFSVACNDRKLNKQTGEWEDGDATFLNCSGPWRQHAENVAESLRRGHRVVVFGRLRQRSYEKDGERRTVLDVDVEEVTPSLKWATAKVTKVERNGGSTGGNAPAKESGFRKSGGGTKPADDPWGSVPPPSGPSDEEPPF